MRGSKLAEHRFDGPKDLLPSHKSHPQTTPPEAAPARQCVGIEKAGMSALQLYFFLWGNARLHLRFE